MDTFNIFKEKYIEAKLQYLHYLDMDYSDRYPNIDPDTEGYVEVGPYTIKRGETLNQLMIAADLMTGYITHCVMNEIDHDEYMCFFEGDHTIEDTWHPQFEFSFKFMAMPKLELLKEKHPSLLKICDEIQFGNTSINLVRRALNEAKIPHSEILEIREYSDNDLMRIPFPALIDNLQDEGERLIRKFAEELKKR